MDAWARQAGEHIVWRRTQPSDIVHLLLPEPALAGNLAVSECEEGAAARFRIAVTTR